MKRIRSLNRLEKYFDPEIGHEEMKRIVPGIMDNSARFKAELTRDELRKRGFLKKNVVRYCYRPFDVRWLYWEPETKLLDEKRTEYFLQIFEGNVWLKWWQRNRKEDFYPPHFTSILADRHIIESKANVSALAQTRILTHHRCLMRFRMESQREFGGCSERVSCRFTLGKQTGRVVLPHTCRSSFGGISHGKFRRVATGLAASAVA